MNDKIVDGLKGDVPPREIRGDQKIRGSFHPIKGMFNELLVVCSTTDYHWAHSTCLGVCLAKSMA